MEVLRSVLMKLRKFDDELQIVYGEVYAPDVIDSQGDTMTEVAIQEMAHSFMKNQNVKHIDTNHDGRYVNAVVVESFLARKGDPDFIAGSWVVGVHVEDAELWHQIKKGDFNGFSMDGQGVGTYVDVEIEIPEYVFGKTDSVHDHDHEFTVKFDDDGNFVGGETDVVSGHKHKIVRGTVTEIADGHSHRFSYVEGF